MKSITILFALIVFSLALRAQDTSNIFIGEWQIEEFKTVIGGTNIYTYQRDSLEKCQRLMLNILRENNTNPTKADTLSAIAEVKSNFDALNNLIYMFISDTVLILNGVNKPYKIDTKKHWIMLDPSNLEAGWASYKVKGNNLVELWQGILGGWHVITLRRK